MSAKPATTPVQWDANDTNITTPTAGQQSDGAAASTILASGIFNYLMRWLTAWVIYLSDGIIQHAEKDLFIPAAGGTTVDGGTGGLVGTGGTISPSWTAGAASDTYQVPIELDVGERLKAIRAGITGTVANTINMKIWEVDPSSGTPLTQIGSTQTSANSATFQTLSVTGLTHMIATGRFYVVEFVAGGVNLQVHMTRITYDRVTS